MQRDFKEKKQVEVNVSHTVCDICGNLVEDETAFIRVFASRDQRPYVDENVLDICSTACLKANVDGIKLVLDSKVVPALKKSAEKSDCYEEVKKSSSPAYPSIFIPVTIGK